MGDLRRRKAMRFAQRTLQAQQILINFLSMTRFGSAGGSSAEIAFAEFSLEELKGERVAQMRQGGIGAGTFIAHESGVAIEFVPGEMKVGGGHCVVEEAGGFAGAVGGPVAEARVQF